jgi:hypothetical protein
MPNVATPLDPEGGATLDAVASVMVSWTGPVNAPEGTVAVMVAVPIVASAVPPLGWMVVEETTLPGKPVAVLPVPPVGVYPEPAAKAAAGVNVMTPAIRPTAPNRMNEYFFMVRLPPFRQVDRPP